MTELGWRCVDGEPEDAVAAPVRAGGMLVFSSLTPHATGPNRSDRVRKSYIVQFAPDGAVLVDPNGGDGERIRCDAADRQYPILIDGKPAQWD